MNTFENNIKHSVEFAIKLKIKLIKFYSSEFYNLDTPKNKVSQILFDIFVNVINNL